MDSILIEGVRCQAHIGTTAEERETLQTIEIDVELFLDLKTAGNSDQIEDTVNYLAVARRIQELTLENRFHLLERLAEELSTEILTCYPIEEIRLRLHKFPKTMMEIASAVAIEIRRKRPAISKARNP